MNAHQAIGFSIKSSEDIVSSYLGDLNDADLLHRPAPGCNHINWQLGHLIVAENKIISDAVPGSMPALPAGFAEKYTKETSTVDDPKKLCSKDELMRVYQQQRAATKAALEKTSEKDLDKPLTGWTPNVGAAFAGATGMHWLMQVGQWAVVRRQLGRPPLF